MRNLPIALMFYCFPLVSIAARIAGYGQLNYDYFWVPAFAAVLVLSLGTRIQKKHVVLLAWLSLFLFLKYVLPLLFYGNVQLKPWAMDCKWVVYLVFSILWVNRFGVPSGEVIYKGSLFFAKVYIIFIIVKILAGPLNREGILMEANYDGFMILMGFCLIDQYKRGKSDWLFFILATFLTFSRTGFIAMFVLLAYRAFRRHWLFVVPLVSVFVGVAVIALFFRSSESVRNMDRFIFFYQAYVYFSQTNIWNVLLGSTPGVSLDMTIVNGFSWFAYDFEELRGLTGIYPFYFHSTYIRLALTWGIFGFLAYLFFFVYKFYTSKMMSTKYFCLLVLVQSLSLSVMTIQNVSILFFLMLFL